LALLARQVAEQLMAHDALSAQARDELGISATSTARPVQAALASAASFAIVAALPLVIVLLLPQSMLVLGVVGISLVLRRDDRDNPPPLGPDV
jgi:VIT1/CCC1 family predicted Fe2+/Mn2+ transporter